MSLLWVGLTLGQDTHGTEVGAVPMCAEGCMRVGGRLSCICEAPHNIACNHSGPGQGSGSQSSAPRRLPEHIPVQLFSYQMYGVNPQPT